ncbi:PAS domain-containing protein [bacterium]|nr:PAS domain-containing protein [bacterium]
MNAIADRSVWVGRLYAIVGALAILAMLLAAWWTNSRAPERQANRWGQVQLQSLRQSRERLQDSLSSLEQRVRSLADSPIVFEENPDQGKLSDEFRRAMAGEDVDGISFQRIDDAGKVRFDISSNPIFGSIKTMLNPTELESILEWGRDPKNSRQTRVDLERTSASNDSETRVTVRISAPLREPAGAPMGLFILRFPLKEFLSALLIPSQLTPETYTFVIERGNTENLLVVPSSVLWHFRHPRWADVFLSDTEPFVRAITQPIALDESEGDQVMDVPQTDGETRREIVSWLQSSLGDRRWLIGMSTPYADAVLSTRGQQSMMVILAGLTLAVLGAGAALLLYQRTLLRIEATRERQAQLDRMRHNYQELFAENPTAIMVLSPEGRFLECNRSAENLLGLSSTDAVNKRLMDVFEQASYQSIWEPMEAQGFLHATDARLVRKIDQKATLVEAWGRKMGEQVILMVQDVEQRRDLDRQIARLRRMDSMGSLASTMAHDFNNILGQIQILISNLRSEIPAEAVWHADLATVEDKVEDASILVSNLLSFRENVLSSEPVDPHPILQEYLQQQAKLLPPRIELVSDVRPDLPSIWLSASSLRRILDNLIRNACDAMPTGGTLVVRARPKWIEAREATEQLPTGNYAQIEVSDTGVGMSPQMLDTIFEPFFTTKTEGKGTGLGLWTIYKILRRVRGGVHVHSQLGRGTRITIYLSSAKPIEDIDSPGLEMARPNR